MTAVTWGWDRGVGCLVTRADINSSSKLEQILACYGWAAPGKGGHRKVRLLLAPSPSLRLVCKHTAPFVPPELPRAGVTLAAGCSCTLQTAKQGGINDLVLKHRELLSPQSLPDRVKTPE